jgi:hypothetical protein
MTKQEKIDTVVKNAVEAQIRDDLCARSTMYGLSAVFDFIPESVVTGAASLSGGCGSASGSCGAYCCGLPYYVGGVIEDRSELLLVTPQMFKFRFNIDVRVGHNERGVLWRPGFAYGDESGFSASAVL